MQYSRAKLSFYFFAILADNIECKGKNGILQLPKLLAKI